jgi:hypothetical protein
MTQQLAEMIERVKTWPEKRQDDAARMLQAMEDGGTDVYHLTDAERRAIDEGLASEVVPEAEMEKFWHRHAA